MAGTVGPAWFSQPIVVIVTFEKDQLQPSGKKRPQSTSAGLEDFTHLLFKEKSSPLLLDAPLPSQVQSAQQ